MYSRYEFREGALKGLSVGGGVTYIDDQIPQGLFLKSTTQVDVFARYRTQIFDRPAELTLNVYNLFDEIIENQWGVIAPPLRVQAGINLRF
jgi:outer membrane receptor protein involved in Fe transport